MEINTTILPLYQELIRQRFTDFMHDTNFVRSCNRAGISNEYAAAYNSAVEVAKNSYFGIFFEGMESYENLLAELLNRTYSSHQSAFADIVCVLVIADLESASRLITIDEIQKDLDSLGLDPKKNKS